MRKSVNFGPKLHETERTIIIYCLNIFFGWWFFNVSIWSQEFDPRKSVWRGKQIHFYLNEFSSNYCMCHLPLSILVCPSKQMSWSWDQTMMFWDVKNRGINRNAWMIEIPEITSFTPYNYGRGAPHYKIPTMWYLIYKDLNNIWMSDDATLFDMCGKQSCLPTSCYIRITLTNTPTHSQGHRHKHTNPHTHKQAHPPTHRDTNKESVTQTPSEPQTVTATELLKQAPHTWKTST